ncbi:helix-turn-helix domain-containing protein [Acinetobacter nosocomialis]|uniref:hypothetical protein n=1 Tax=Acinetobacter nosocomialis TaxID=106654 RepID=UPI000A32DC2D|nr:hypothetical protein [Acinetobacter nosocomialis]OTL15712.1 hypothetical protein B9X80_04625 [Acinetobacter nosocomialis]
MEGNIFQKLADHFGSQELAGKAIGVTQGTMSGYINNRWGMSETVAMRAQRATKGKFKASDLCPSLKEFDDEDISTPN